MGDATLSGGIASLGNLDKAIDAFNAALEVRTREKVPLDRDVIFLATADEEADFKGALRAISKEGWHDRLAGAEFSITEGGENVLEADGRPLYFGVDTATLLPAMRETGADVIGLDWRVPLDQGWSTLGHSVAVQGNLDPIMLFAEEDLLRQRVHQILAQAGGRPGHIFNLGHGIVPGTPVENVQRVVQYVREYSTLAGVHSRA